MCVWPAGKALKCHSMANLFRIKESEEVEEKSNRLVT